MEIPAAVFAVVLALFLAHEMDAVRRREWEMLPVLKKMDGEKAYSAFLLLHIPLIALILFALTAGYETIAYYVIDIFLILHLIVHIIFRNHQANGLTGTLSKTLIFLSGLTAAVHMIMVLLL